MQFLQVLVTMTTILYSVKGDFGAITEHKDLVMSDDTVTAEEAVNYLASAYWLLEEDVISRDQYLSDSLVEISQLLEYITEKSELGGYNAEQLVNITTEGIWLAEMILSGVNKETCTKFSNINCVLNFDKGFHLVDSALELTMRLTTKIMEFPEYESVEVYGGNISIGGIKTALKNVVQTDVVLDHLGFPNVPENDIPEDLGNEEIRIFAVSFDSNPYSFASGPDLFNGGIYKDYILDKDNNYVRLHQKINIFVNAAPILHQSNYQSINKNESTDEAVLSVTMSSNLDGGLVTIRMSSLQQCVTVATGDTSSFQVTTYGLNTTREDSSPENVVVSFRDQTLQLALLPPAETLELHVNCEACMQSADIVFIMDNSGSVKDDQYLLSVQFIYTLVEKLDVNPSKVRIGLMTFGMDARAIFHLNTYQSKESVLNAIEFTKNNRDRQSGTDTANAISTARTSMMFIDGRTVQKIAMVITDGESHDPVATANEADILRNAGVDMVAIGVGSGVNMDEINSIADEPKEYRVFIADDFNALDYLADTLIEVICRGKWSNLTAPQGNFGIISSFLLNETSGTWTRSEILKLSDVQHNELVFESSFLGTVGIKVVAIAPETIDFDEIIKNIDERIEDSPAVLATNIALLCLLAVGTVIMRRKDIEDEKRWLYRPLCDNPMSPNSHYFISIHTGLWSSGHLATTPFITLKGFYGNTGPRPLVDKGGMIGSLQRWKVANFMLGTEEHIGPLEEIMVWHDGQEPSCRWYLDKILITEKETGSKYVFLCGDWLANDKGDCKTYKQLLNSHNELHNGKVLFNTLTRFKLFDDYLWLSMFSRPAFSRFSRVQRLYCVASMLSLSMLASAMWFRAEEGTNTYGLQLGPLKINYKQVFVGFMSVAITFPPILLIATIFRNREFRNSYGRTCTNYQPNMPDIKKAILPWPSVFLGYVIAFGAIGSGFTFTFFYSLQWGNDISTDWLLSLLFGTTNEMFMLEPLKVVFFSILISCIFKGLARRDIMEMAPFIVEESLLKIDLKDIPRSRWPGGMETFALENLRKRLLLDSRLFSHLQVIFTHGLYIILVACICSHNYVNSSFLQNDALINQLKPLRQINNTEDIWSWLEEVYVPNIFPKRSYNGDFKLPPERALMSDGCSYRMGPVRLRQIRVKGNCDVQKTMEKVVQHCKPPVDSTTEETENYCPGWTPYFGNCKKSGFAYTKANSSSAFPFFGTFHRYDGGGYIKDMNPFEVDVYYELSKLRSQDWIDDRTRFIVVEIVSMNVNTKLFSLVSMRFEKPHTGGIFFSVQTQSSRLYPYINPWDYIILGLQCIFIVVTFFRLVFLVYDVWKLKTGILVDVYYLGSILGILMSLTAIGCYIGRIDRTIFIVEEIFNSADQFMSFEIVQLLDDIYKGCIGVVLFISILQLLQPLSFNYYIYVMKASIAISKQDLGSFGFFTAIPLAAFASLTYCTLSHQSYSFRDLPSSFLSLFRTMLAMVRFQDIFESDDAFDMIVFTIFIFTMAIILVNIFVCILNDSFAYIREKGGNLTETEPFDTDLNEHFWWKVNQALNVCSKGKNDDTGANYSSDEHRRSFQQNMMQLDQMINDIFKTIRQSNRVM